MPNGWTRKRLVGCLAVAAVIVGVIALTPFKGEPLKADLPPLLYFNLSEMEYDAGFRDSLLAIQSSDRILHLDLGQVWVEGRIEYLNGDTLLLKDYQGGKVPQ
jgi:hypothetical protein